MTVSHKTLLRYWRGCLLDAARTRNLDDFSFHEVSFNDLSLPHLHEDLVNSIKKDAPQKERELFERADFSLNVVIVPILLHPKYEHGSSNSIYQETIVPLWIEGSLFKGGFLKPSRAFIDRTVMSPLGLGHNHSAFTSLSAVDEHLDQEGMLKPNDGENWNDFWKRISSWMEPLFSAPFDSWHPENMVRSSAIAYTKDFKSPAGPICELYEHIEAAEKVPVLFERLSSGAAAATLIPRCGNSHLGQMGNLHALNQGQRTALDSTLALGKGQLLAVNGPPGTGKTTLLQSVIASLWVKSAAEGNDPPVILASSTNNQAITNVLASLASSSLDESHPLFNSTLAQRWIPDLKQYGLYLPAKRRREEIESKIKKQKGEFIDAEDVIAYPNGGKQPWSGLPALTENEPYLLRAIEFFNASAMDWSGSELEISGIVELLRKKLREQIEEMNTAIILRQSLLNDTLEQHHPQPFNPATKQRELASELESATSRMETLELTGRDAISEYHGLLGCLFGWLPQVRKSSWNRASRLLSKQSIKDPAWGWETLLSEADLRAWLSKKSADYQTEIDLLSASLVQWTQWNHLVQTLFPQITEHDLLGLFQSEDQFQAALDKGVRFELFHLAARYWEGRWILQMEGLLKKSKMQPDVFGARGKWQCEDRWRRFAKLTPCLVSTTHNTPRLFDSYNGETLPLLEFIDLLIVDEAGQVSSSTGAALFALAQKAMVVGDVNQIEPTWEISNLVDLGNLTHHGLVQEEHALEEFNRSGLRAYSGSIMKMARENTAFTEDSTTKGVILTEHWRCHPDVIAYCNTLAYEGKLVPMRKAEVSYILPRLGYAHVNGHCQSKGTSRYNIEEALILAQWLKKHRQELLDTHASENDPSINLGQIVAIITPFNIQVPEIRKALLSEGISSREVDQITIGTIHTLQGAERPVILFSPVYNSETRPGTLFFDRDVNMLNVAVSRAKESFLVFGDMALFKDNGSKRPSSILARYLYSDPANEIRDIDPVLAKRVAKTEISRIQTLQGHRELLQKAIREANETLLIVSPYLSDLAIQTDGLISLFSDAISKKKLIITIAYDKKLNELKPNAKRAMEALLSIPHLDLRPLDGIHNKTLVIDNRWIVEGSFNWLSAARSQNHPYYRKEVSLIYGGNRVHEFSAQAWKQVGGIKSPY